MEKITELDRAELKAEYKMAAKERDFVWDDYCQVLYEMLVGAEVWIEVMKEFEGRRD